VVIDIECIFCLFGNLPQGFGLFECHPPPSQLANSSSLSATLLLLPRAIFPLETRISIILAREQIYNKYLKEYNELSTSQWARGEEIKVPVKISLVMLVGVKTGKDTSLEAAEVVDQAAVDQVRDNSQPHTPPFNHKKTHNLPPDRFSSLAHLQAVVVANLILFSKDKSPSSCNNMPTCWEDLYLMKKIPPSSTKVMIATMTMH